MVNGSSTSTSRKGGAGFFNTMRIYPELKLGVVAMGNLTSWNYRQLARAVTERS